MDNPSELLALLVILKYLKLGAVVADALQDLLHVFHEPVVEDWLVEFDVSEVTLTLSSLSAGLALLVKGGDTKSEVVGA